MKVEYKKGDVWLCEYGHENVPLTILDIAGGYVRHKHGWDSSEEWHGMAKAKLGTRVYFLGIPLWIKR